LALLLFAAASFPVGALAAGAGSGMTFKVPLRGANVVPRGARNGTGFVVIKVHPGKSRICWKFSGLTRIGRPIGASINEAAKGKSGPVVEALGKSYKQSGCAKASKNVIAAITRRPATYYVLVSTVNRPSGAIRGQLAK
jgi:hypothetical protein